jgi:DNA-binding transcriptional regulator YdaS (Cro superfamily)
MEAIQAVGSAAELARRLGIRPQSIQGWETIPSERVREIERITKVPREKLRPDLYI